MKFYKYYFLVVALFIGTNSFSQEADYSLAKVGEKVSWVLYSKQFVGEVIGLDDKFHKASIKYVDDENNEKVSKVPYLKLTKIK